MSKEYIFKYHGTKESFTSDLKKFPTTDGQLFYFDDYIIKLTGDEIHIGIERMGHSGGNWFISKFDEKDNELEFKGEVRYIGPSYSPTRIQRIFDKSGEFIGFILLFPILVIVKLYQITEWCIRKICKRPKAKEKSTEEKLFDLMENHLGCVAIQTNNNNSNVA